jgi:NAD(P)-dependent dehydrogenase (short-subunit alcohol dehydrogenase family)
LRSLYEADAFLNRWADPDEVADACVFLLSPASSYVNAHSLVLNGGGNVSAHR